MEECDEVCSLAQPQEDLHQRLQNQNYRGMMFVRLVHKPASLMNNISAPKMTGLCDYYRTGHIKSIVNSEINLMR